MFLSGCKVFLQCCFYLLLCSAMSWASPSVAAQIRLTENFMFDIIPVVELSGQIRSGDADQLVSVISEFEEAGNSEFEDEVPSLVLSLDSHGGSFQESIELARVIHGRGNIITLVRRGAECRSACAVVFMYGYSRSLFGEQRSRFLEPGGILAFHRPRFEPQVTIDESALNIPPAELAALLEQEYTRSYDAAGSQIQQLLQIDINAINSKLLGRMLTAVEKEFIYIDSIGDAIDAGIKILNIPDPPRETKMELKRTSYWLCVNMMYDFYGNTGYAAFQDRETEIFMTNEELDTWVSIRDKMPEKHLQEHYYRGDSTTYIYSGIESSSKFVLACDIVYERSTERFFLSGIADGWFINLPANIEFIESGGPSRVFNFDLDSVDFERARLYGHNRSIRICSLDGGRFANSIERISELCSILPRR